MGCLSCCNCIGLKAPLFCRPAVEHGVSLIRQCAGHISLVLVPEGDPTLCRLSCHYWGCRGAILICSLPMCALPAAAVMA